MANLEDLSVGTPVRVYNADFPDGNPTGTIAAINDVTQMPGKQILVRLDQQHPKAHGGEPLLNDQGEPYKVNGEWAMQLSKGYGWYSRAEDLALLS